MFLAAALLAAACLQLAAGTRTLLAPAPAPVAAEFLPVYTYAGPCAPRAPYECSAVYQADLCEAGLRLAGTKKLPDSPCMVMLSVSSPTASACVMQHAPAASLIHTCIITPSASCLFMHYTLSACCLAELGCVPARSPEPDPAAAAIPHQLSGARAPLHAVMPLSKTNSTATSGNSRNEAACTYSERLYAWASTPKASLVA